MRKPRSGLVERYGLWYIDKTISGRRIREGTGTDSLDVAERILAKRTQEIYETVKLGERLTYTWSQAAARYLRDTKKSSVRCDITQLDKVHPYIGKLPLEAVHMGSLRGFIEDRQREGRKARTINYALQVVRRILNLAATVWMDERGRTWLQAAPKIILLRESDRRAPYPMSREEQVRFFDELPEHLRQMALFKVNTGCREQEVCELRWEWEVDVPELNASVFLIPGKYVKNRDDRLVVLNRVAWAVIKEQRGKHGEFVFCYRGQQVCGMLRSAWRKARVRAGMPDLHVHDLKHTFGRRLRAAGVSFEDRQDLLGHRSGRMTTHYSQAELANLIESANRACSQPGHFSVTLTVLKRRAG